MFTLAQPSYGYYNPYELAMQQELQRRRQIETYLFRQRETEEMERRRREYEAAVRAEYEHRREAELERRRQAELQRRRQAQQARDRHSMYDGRLEPLFDALYGGQLPRQEREWEDKREEKGSTVSAYNDTPTPVPASAPVPTSAAAESQPEPEEPQVDTAPSHAAVQSILSSFATLQSKFTFPSQLDFLPGLSPKLAYTPNNAPLHEYEHALTGLLTQLDAVESYGDGEVRKARKEAVKTIERELERLDGMRAEAWQRITEPKSGVLEPVSTSAGVDVDPLSVPLPEDPDAVDEEMEDPLEELPTIDQPSEESLAPADSTVANQVESTAQQDAGQSASTDESIDADPAPVPTLPTPVAELTPHDITLDTPSTHIQTPDLEPLTRSLTPPSPWEANESDSISDPELEEYVNIETMSTSEDEDTDLEEVGKNGDLEMMRDWDLDF
ncbi:hypothetical protein FRC11_013016 [Ceratobasidium sp. 423]|nr:hypothetical protein FRC11_013016 [Ceratobasidium sp. 423]